MAPIQCRLEPNFLTVPPSSKIRFIPRDSDGTDELAAAMSAENPNYTEEAAKTMLVTLVRVLKKTLLDGKQATIDGALTFGLSFTGKLDSPDDPLPHAEEILHVDVHALPAFLREVRQQAQLEKIPMVEKVPLLNAAEDTRLHLADVLYSQGVLKLTGTNLFFNPEAAGSECVLEGLRSGRQVQAQFGPVSDGSTILVPSIPAQDELWQNEYTVSISTRYTSHGSPRTGTYHRRLRSVLLIERLAYETGPGILSASTAAAPCASFESAIATAPELVRIQAVFDIRNNWLLLNLLSLQEDGPAGAAVTVTFSSSVTLPGFTGSAISSMTVVVQDYAALTALVRDHYYGRLVDVLDIRAGG